MSIKEANMVQIDTGATVSIVRDILCAIGFDDSDISVYSTPDLPEILVVLHNDTGEAEIFNLNGEHSGELWTRKLSFC